MALYEFKCSKCEHVFTERYPMSDIGKPDCPQCEEPEAERRYSQLNFKIEAANITAAKKAGLNIDHYEKAREKREARIKETGEKKANEEIVNHKLNDITQRQL